MEIIHDLKNIDGKLFLALVKGNRINLVRKVLEHKPEFAYKEVERKNKEEYPIVAAYKSKNTKMIDLLCEHGARPQDIPLKIINKYYDDEELFIYVLKLLGNYQDLNNKNNKDDIKTFLERLRDMQKYGEYEYIENILKFKIVSPEILLTCSIVTEHLMSLIVSNYPDFDLDSYVLDEQNYNLRSCYVDYVNHDTKKALLRKIVTSGNLGLYREPTSAFINIFKDSGFTNDEPEEIIIHPEINNIHQDIIPIVEDMGYKIKTETGSCSPLGFPFFLTSLAVIALIKYLIY